MRRNERFTTASAVPGWSGSKAMRTFQFGCGRCKKKISLSLASSSVQAVCPECRSEIFVDAFPALFQEAAPGVPGEVVLAADQSNCFFHPAKRAVVTCESCGRFLCALCDIELGGRHLCSRCIERETAKGNLQQLENHRTRYDDIALALAIWPILIIWITCITAIASIYIAVRYWKSPRSIVRGSNFRFISAIIIALLQLMGWSYLGFRLLFPLFQ